MLKKIWLKFDIFQPVSFTGPLLRICDCSHLKRGKFRYGKVALEKKELFDKRHICSGPLFTALPGCQSFCQVLTVAVFFGFFVGSLYVNGTLVYSESFPEHLASALGLSCMFRSLTSIIVGPVISMFRIKFKKKIVNFRFPSIFRRPEKRHAFQHPGPALVLWQPRDRPDGGVACRRGLFLEKRRGRKRGRDCYRGA